jgi:hypothetical protein
MNQHIVWALIASSRRPGSYALDDPPGTELIAGTKIELWIGKCWMAGHIRYLTGGQQFPDRPPGYYLVSAGAIYGLELGMSAIVLSIAVIRPRRLLPDQAALTPRRRSYNN